MGQFELAEIRLTEAKRAAEVDGSMKTQGLIDSFFALLHGRRGRPRLAIRAFEAALGAMEAAQDPRRVAFLRCSVAAVELRCGDFDAATRLRAGVEQCSAVGHYRAAIDFITQLAGLFYCLGELDEVEELVRQGQRLLTRMSVPRYARDLVALCRLQKGHTVDDRALAEEPLSPLEPLVQAEFARASGKMALEKAREARRRMDANGFDIVETPVVYCTLVRTLVDVGRQSEADNARSEARALVEGYLIGVGGEGAQALRTRLEPIRELLAG